MILYLSSISDPLKVFNTIKELLDTGLATGYIGISSPVIT